MVVDERGEEFLEEEDVLMLIAAIIGVSIEEAKSILIEAVDSGDVTEYVLDNNNVVENKKEKGLVQ